MMGNHWFTFSRNWSGTKRRCGTCDQTYEAGEHIEVTALKPYTSYICSNGGNGRGHSSQWTGAYLPELRSPNPGCLVCGAPYVEEDKEEWELKFEIKRSSDSPWHPVSRVGSRHSTDQQRDGLDQLIADGELIRNLSLEQLARR